MEIASERFNELQRRSKKVIGVCYEISLRRMMVGLSSINSFDCDVQI